MNFDRLFGKPKQPDLKESLKKLQEVRELLEKKERLIQRKIDAEVEKAKEYSKAKNKRAAIQCLKKKKLYEQQMENLSAYQFRIQDQEVMMEGATDTAEMVGAMRTSAQVLKNVQKQMYIGDVDKAMDEINEQAENMRQIQEALAQPISGTEIDEDELLDELEELESLEIDEQLLEPVGQSVSSSVAMSLPSVPSRAPAVQKQAQEEDDDLERLKREMAI